ncbi:MAG: hypothetical protein J5639_06880 [Bacteroidales bacterium]|nr:hypothetical protein [Bacteroidales bacterium]
MGVAILNQSSPSGQDHSQDRAEHSVNVGVCNVTNHFNPFMLYFDAESESWKEIALLPIMPNFSYRVTF